MLVCENPLSRVVVTKVFFFGFVSVEKSIIRC